MCEEGDYFECGGQEARSWFLTTSQHQSRIIMDCPLYSLIPENMIKPGPFTEDTTIPEFVSRKRGKPGNPLVGGRD
jgi:hypothetical protein